MVPSCGVFETRSMTNRGEFRINLTFALHLFCFKPNKNIFKTLAYEIFYTLFNSNQITLTKKDNFFAWVKMILSGGNMITLKNMKRMSK